MILADAHLHLFERGYPGLYGRSLLAPDIEVYEALRARHAVAAGLVIGYQGDGGEPGNNRFIRTLAQVHRWMVTLAYVEVTGATAPQLEALLDEGHAGIALYLGNQATAEVVAAWSVRTWGVLASRRALVSLNADAPTLLALRPIVDAQRGCTFLVSHLGAPGPYVRAPGKVEARERLAGLLELADLPNVGVKLSGLYAISDPPHAYPHEAAVPFLDLVLATFGQERCFWGSDFSPALDHVSFAQTVSVPWLDGLPDDTRRLVMGGNLLRLLGRSPPHT